MREILFRGKRWDNGEWVYGDLIHDGIDYNMAIRGMGSHSVIAVDSATVGQYTGLTDKNGKKIFEGDIVVEYGLTGGIFAMGPVAWCDTFVSWQVVGKSMYSQHLAAYKVIGNIHDNLELLEDYE